MLTQLFPELKQAILGLPFFEVVVYSTIVVYLCQSYIALRQRSKLHAKKAPEELLRLKLTDEQSFIAGNEYCLDKNSVGLCKETFETVLSIYWLSHLLGYCWQWSNIFDEVTPSTDGSKDYYREVVRNILFVVLVTLIGSVTDSIWSAYSTFVIEERHSFNNTTLSLFVSDKVKEFGISIVFIMILVPLTMGVVSWAGDDFALYLWLVVSIIIVAMMWLIPVLILPCFYTFEELNEGHLSENTRHLITELHSMAKSVKFPLTKIFVMDGSKRSSHSNAFQYGFGSNKRVVLFDTILEQCSTDEIVAIMAHELGHWQMSHTIKQLISTEFQMLLLFELFSLVANNEGFFEAFGFVGEQPTMVGFFLFLYAWQPLASIWLFFSNALTRHFEYQADQFAVDLKRGSDLYNALVTIHETNKAALDPDWLYSAYHHSHPTLLERLTAITVALDKRE